MAEEAKGTLKYLKAENIFIETSYENSNPPLENISIDDEGVCNIFQRFEEGASSGYSFHLNVAFINENLKPSRIKLRIHWGETEYDFCRDYMYVGYDSGTAWRMITIPCDKSISEFEIIVPRGRHLLCCSPKFDNGDYRLLLEKYQDTPNFKIMEIAETPEKRKISCFKLGAGNGNKVIITTRAHGYETSGAYCIKGLLADFVRNSQEYEEFLRKYQLYIFPMLNPDAVAAGNCCISTSGVNFGKDLGDKHSHLKDKTTKTLTEFIMHLKPAYYLDMHNNTGPHLADSFRSNSLELLEIFSVLAPDMSVQQKMWNIYKKDFNSERLMVMCHEKFSTDYMLTEFPWYCRLPEDMEEFGIKFFRTLFKIF
ncbi:MAG: hypothetical protein A2017_18980 [Lentisphaerae bacterium GWF2_44_16]|nr:MAG: hypothetical protein A2017_18980 [Lentisphaerae bacterium GWF2_44_16]